LRIFPPDALLAQATNPVQGETTLMKRHTLVLLAAAAAALAAPAAATADTTLSVQGDRIVFAGDDAATTLWVEPVDGGEQTFEVDSTIVLGDGCHYAGATPGSPGGPPPPGSFEHAACSLAGVTAFQANAGGGDDQIKFWSTVALGIPTFVDMGPGNDRWDLGSSVTDTVEGGEGNDVIVNGAGDDVLRGGPGDDVVYGGDFDQGNDQIQGDDGNDNLDGLAGNDTIDGGAGDDNLQPGEGDDAMDGGPGDDAMTGGPGNDSLLGGEGNDTIGGVQSGQQVQCGEPGDDVLDGGPGDDRVCGGQGIDTITGGAGDDVVGALDSARDDTVACGDGYDLVATDLIDPVGLDCERQAQADPVGLPASGILPVPVRCAPVACSGTLTITPSPNAPTPTAANLPSPPVAAKGKVLLRSKVKLGSGSSKLRVRLPAKTVKQLRRSGRTSVEARLQVVSAGKKVTVRRTFPIAKK
jgi:Ca2+-binding RTX toxin-like protein